MSIEGIDRHSIADTVSIQDPNFKFLNSLKFMNVEPPFTPVYIIYDLYSLKLGVICFSWMRG